MSQILDIRFCSAEALAAGLMNYRGNDDESLQILLDATKIVTERIGEKKKNSSNNNNNDATIPYNNNDDDDESNNNDDNDNIESSFRRPILKGPIETSLLSPRLGKFVLQCYLNHDDEEHDEHDDDDTIRRRREGGGGIVLSKLNDPSIKIVLPTNMVSHVLVFPKPEDCKALLLLVTNRNNNNNNDNNTNDDDNNNDNNSNNNNRKKLPKLSSGNLVLIRLRSSITVQNNKRINELCFSLPFDKKLGPLGPILHDDDNDEKKEKNQGEEEDGKEENYVDNDSTEGWCRVLQQSLIMGNHRTDTTFVRVRPGQQSTSSTPSSTSSGPPVIDDTGGSFCSYSPPNTSTTTGGMPFISCYHGVNDGVLYPLREGLLFYKPPKFFPRSTLHSIACGRAGGGGGPNSSRYVDLVIQIQEEEEEDDVVVAGTANNKSSSSSSSKRMGDSTNLQSVEFTNIQREENGVLDTYIHNVLIPAMKEDANKASTTKTGESQRRPDGRLGINGQDEPDANNNDDDDDGVIVEAVAVEDDNDDEDDEGESDEDDEDFVGDDDDNEGWDDEDHDDDEGDVFGQKGGEDDDDDDDDDGFTEVQDDFAKHLASERRKKRESGEDSSATESECEDGSSRPSRRASKRLRQGAR